MVLKGGINEFLIYRPIHTLDNVPIRLKTRPLGKSGLPVSEGISGVKICMTVFLFIIPITYSEQMTKTVYAAIAI